jgi:hypothetical protein
LIQQLRDELLLEVKLSPEWMDPERLRRYLRGRKHDIAKAKAMVLATLEWRKSVGADTINDTFNFHEKAEFHKNYPEGFFCTDRKGRPVYVQQPGNIDTAALWKFTTMDRCIKYHISQQEKYVNKIAPAASIASGNHQSQSLILIDMEGVGVSTITGEVRTIMGKVMAIDQDYYPELMYKALIINAPTTFRVIWSMVKYLLDARTQAKIEVLPVDYRPQLLEHIAPENLMIKYGGKNATPLIEEPGPWQDENVLKEVERQQLAIRSKYGAQQN